MAREVLFETFQGVKCPAHRAWNQMQFARHLDETHGDAVSAKYYDSLTEPEKMNILVMASRSLIKGEDFVLRELNKMAQEK